MKKITDLPTLLILDGKLEQKIKELEAERAEVKAWTAEVMKDEVYNLKALQEAMARFYNGSGCPASITDEVFKFMHMTRDKTGNNYAIYKAIQDSLNGYAARHKAQMPSASVRFALVHKGELVTGTSTCSLSTVEYSVVRVTPKWEKAEILAVYGSVSGCPTQQFHPGQWMYAVIQLGAAVQGEALRVRGDMLLKEATKQAALMAPVEF